MSTAVLGGKGLQYNIKVIFEKLISREIFIKAKCKIQGVGLLNLQLATATWYSLLDFKWLVKVRLNFRQIRGFFVVQHCRWPFPIEVSFLHLATDRPSTTAAVRRSR